MMDIIGIFWTRAMASNLLAMASNLVAMASNLASNLLAMASKKTFAGYVGCMSSTRLWNDERREVRKVLVGSP